jgi:hypothetical protein
MDRSFGSASINIVSARFELLPGAAEPGWAMRVSGSAKNILHRAAPFVARVGEQRLESLGVNAEGDAFEGYLRRVPNQGDRLHVGYSAANTPTAFTFRPGSDGPTVV